nr:hypothetical protein [Thermoanaerobaculia bacterium]
APVSAPVQAPAAATPNPDSRSSSQLSRAERDELLAQINRAADRLTRTQKLMEKAQDALTRGERTLAERLVVTIEGIDPKTKGLPELKAQVSELAEKADLERQRLREAEGLLVRYLDQRQAPLAKLALETLRELAPDHANLAVYQQRLAGLSEEARESEEVKREISAIRQALAEGELDRAGQRIARLRAASASAAERLAKELDEARTRQSREREAAELRQRFEDDVASGRLERAEQELSALNQLAASRATLAIYRDQLEEARRLAAQAEQAQPFESRFAAALETGDWQAAREVALAMEKELPGHPRPAALFAEAERLRASSERQQAVHQGVRQIEQLLTQGRADQAELALKVLAKLDPANPRLGYFERRIAALRP